MSDEKLVTPEKLVTYVLTERKHGQPEYIVGVYSNLDAAQERFPGYWDERSRGTYAASEGDYSAIIQEWVVDD